MQKRKFRRRPTTSGSKRFTFHSYGSVYSFAPFRIVEDDRRINEAGWFDRVRQLDLYRDEVRMANAKHVFILDDQGYEVKV